MNAEAYEIEDAVDAWIAKRSKAGWFDREERLSVRDQWRVAMKYFQADGPAATGLVVALARLAWGDPWLVTARCQSGGWTVVFGNVIPPRAFFDESEIEAALNTLEAAP
jgi:hypothetical protein